MTTTVRLGYAVPMGAPVDVPLKHLAICGQTQEAGKTTALEGLITRSGLKALTFVTKRGEGSFTTSTRHRPYFREQADWQFVASILEASRGERLKFERAWIIRASRGAQTLREVQINIKRGMKTAKGLSLDVFTVLDAYLDVVVPQIADVNWTDLIELKPGVNVMDLSDIPTEMQHLVIKSSLDWVLQHGQQVVIVIPEAWKFIPQGRGTPVKLAAEALIRQGASLKNYVWLDSQDLGGIDKAILRSVAVWLLGVQREANEIKRTLSNIPAGVTKPTAADLATLDLGEFYACWGKHAIKTYAQPTWLGDDTAHDIAVGRVQRSSKAVVDAFVLRDTMRSEYDFTAMKGRVRGKHDEKETHVTPEQANMLLEENQRLRNVNAEMQRRIETLEIHRHASAEPHKVGMDRPTPENDPAGRFRGAAVVPAFPPGDLPADHDTESLYQAIKARLLKELPNDPAVLQLLDSRPELRVRVRRHVIEVEGSSLRGRIARLIKDDYFTQARTSANVLEELLKRGADRPSNIELGNEMKSLCDMGFFTRENKWYALVPDMKVHVVEE